MPISIWTPTKTEIIKNDIPDGDDVLTKNQLQNKVLIKTRQQVQKKLDKYKDEMLVVGDKVRIHLSAISSEVRKAIKEVRSLKEVFVFNIEETECWRIIKPDFDEEDGNSFSTVLKFDLKNCLRG